MELARERLSPGIGGKGPRLILLDRRSSCELLERKRLRRRLGSRSRDSGAGGKSSTGPALTGLARADTLLGGKGERGRGETRVDWRLRAGFGFRGSCVLLEATEMALELMRRVRPEDAWLPTRGLESF
jgi:hypothetical protein